jgi:hypothetical protein
MNPQTFSARVVHGDPDEVFEDENEAARIFG